MRLILIYFCIQFFCLSIKAQLTNGLNMVLGGGASYFFNDPSLSRRVDNTRFFGVNYVLFNKNKHIAFNPGFVFQSNQYNGKIQEEYLTQIDQHVMSLSLDMLLKANEHDYLRAGLFFNELLASSVGVVNTYNRHSVFYYGSSELEKNYHPTTFQAGVTVGVSIPFKLFKRFHKFNIKLVEFASPLVKEDYNLSKALIGKDTKVMSRKARPTMLTLGFDFNFNRVKKKTEED